ncbi:unnamed protein product, partial [Mesorhabditis belari]|uniref:Succinate-semialdehyde dehydrogenase, mitochondrial n=1 Tax=Mesorhabditis belari TaxID=2138241 RepID=A0AAF3FH76_9BILA
MLRKFVSTLGPLRETTGKRFFEIYRHEHTTTSTPSTSSTSSTSSTHPSTLPTIPTTEEEHLQQRDDQHSTTTQRPSSDFYDVQPSTSQRRDEIAQREHLKKKLGVSQFRKILYTPEELAKFDLSKPPSRENPHPFTADHLPPTYSRALAPHVNGSVALQTLVEFGVDLFEVDTKNPSLGRHLVRLDLDRDLKPRLQWIVNEIGLDVNDLGTYLTRNPFFLIQDLDDMKARVNYLEMKKFKKRQISKIINECRYWINVDVKTLDERLGWMQKEFRLTGDEMRALITKEPRVIQFGIGALERMSKLFKKELKFHPKQAKKILLKDPRVYMLNPKILIETFIYVSRVMRLSNETITEYPLILRCHLSAIRSRHEFLKKLGRASYGQIEENPEVDESATILEGSKAPSTSKDIVPVVDLLDFLSPSDRIFANRAANTYLVIYDEFLRHAITPVKSVESPSSPFRLKFVIFNVTSPKRGSFLCKRQNMANFESVLPQGALCYIDGKWVSAKSGATFEVRNPYSTELLFNTPDCGLDDAKNAVQAARNAFEKWSLETTPKQRSVILQKWFTIMQQKEDKLAELLTREQGKPLAEARGEIQYSASFFEWYAGEARRIYGQVVQSSVLNREHVHVREPIGVVVLITPWNFPTAMIARKAGAALAAGCTLVVKPAHETPLSALALAQTAEEAGLPPGVFNVLTTGHENLQGISRYLCESTDVDAISFTGSTGVGKLLLSQSASTVKRVCLELGGNAPFIVFESADLEKAVKGTMSAKSRGSGQTCVSANRVFVHEKVLNQYVDKLQTALGQLVTGDGLDPKTTQGPLINQRAVDKVQSLVNDAVEKGAKVVFGGKRGKATCYQPTIITGVTNEMEIAQAEIFGPIVAIQTFTDEKDVVSRANSTRFGLAGYIFSSDASQIHRVSRRLQVGMLGVNEGLISCSEAAFGGVKESGLGREGGAQGIDEFTQWKYICTQY